MQVSTVRYCAGQPFDAITASDKDEPLAEVPWDGTLEGETIELKDDEE